MPLEKEQLLVSPILVIASDLALDRDEVARIQSMFTSVTSRGFQVCIDSYTLYVINGLFLVSTCWPTSFWVAFISDELSSVRVESSDVKFRTVLWRLHERSYHSSSHVSSTFLGG
eukprot:scaffold831_cov109-Cylindrotheca_fusiformis.AAC.7